MNDTRELAERIVEVAREHDYRTCPCDCCKVGDVVPSYYYNVEYIEAILREHHEGLLDRLNNTSFIAPGYEGDPEWLETFRVVWLVDVRHVLEVSDD